MRTPRHRKKGFPFAQREKVNEAKGPDLQRAGAQGLKGPWLLQEATLVTK